jgi:hypothetical protein
MLANRQVREHMSKKIMSALLMISLFAFAVSAGEKPNAFTQHVCYEGDIGGYATEARLGYSGDVMGAGDVQKNRVWIKGKPVNTPEGLPLGTDSDIVWSTNTYTLEEFKYHWILSIDGANRQLTIGKKNQVRVTADNQCPQPVPEFATITALIALAGGAATVLYIRKKKN